MQIVLRRCSPLLITLTFACLNVIGLSARADVETSAALRGSVGVAGATVAITHTPTNTKKSVSTNANGSYQFSFLPVGGPYIIEAAADGYQSAVRNDVYLLAGKRKTIDIMLSVDMVEEVVVTAKRVTSESIGPSTTLDRDAMDGIPTINRSVADFVKLDPRVTVSAGSPSNTQISIMGANNRFNDFLIDGVSSNDPFGLNSSGFGTLRNPINLEFVEQISVDIAPYDVSRGNTSSGAIATVTKSGSNDFHGSVYYTSHNQDNVGKDMNGNEAAEFEDTELAVTLSGPIIKDRLFFFVGFSEAEGSTPAVYGTKDSGAVNTAEVVTTAIAQQIADIAKSRYGYDAGSISNVSFPEIQEEQRVKITGNINDRNRFAINYSHTEGSRAVRYNRGATVFSNNWYLKPPVQDTVSVTLWSELTDRLSTKIRYTRSEFEEDAQSVGDSLFPEARITVEDDDGNSDNVYLGGDRYRGANHIMNDANYFNFKATYDMDNHFIKAGIDFSNQEVYNLFMARYNGEIQFDSIADFEAGTWSYLRFHVPLAGVDKPETVAADFEVEKMSFYLQDTWYLNPNWELTYGFRYDTGSTPDQPLLNPKFQERNGIPNNETFEYKQLSPRVAFEHDAKNTIFSGSDTILAARLRGGVGMFLGRIPNVWWGNAFSRSGGLSDYNRFRSYSDTIGPMPAAATADPSFFWVGATSDYEVRSAFFGDAQATDPDFQPETLYRMSLGMDINMADDFDLNIEYVRDEVEDNVFYRDLGLVQTGTLADGRGTYTGASDYMLTNGTKGRKDAITVTVNKMYSDVFGGDLSVYAGYTNMESYDVYGLTSSQAESSYGYMQRSDGENLPSARSSFMAEHKFVAALDFKRNLFGDNETRLSLVLVRKSGEPYSITYDEGRNSITGNYRFYTDYQLAYIPTGANDPVVSFASDAVAEEVMAHINGGNLAAFKGRIAPRNAFNSPWSSRVDFRLTQEVRLFGEHKAIVFFDILNVMNLLGDKNAGKVTEYSYNNSRQIIVGDPTEDGRITITGVDPDDNLFYRNSDRQSVWQTKLGFKYQF